MGDEREHHAGGAGRPSVPHLESCQVCGGSHDLSPDPDSEGVYVCLGCRESIARQQQFIDWGLGEAPDELG